MNYHALFPNAPVVETCIVGTGSFGRSFIFQAQKMTAMNARIAVDVSAATAAKALSSIGIADELICVCLSDAEALKAWQAGCYLALDDVSVALSLPFDVLVEATGDPEAGTRHARMAVQNGKHVVMVSKEADSVIGTGLAQLGRQNGRVVTPVDGDQPSLLISLISWAELLGFEIVAAGKSSEYDIVYDPASKTLTSNGVTVPTADFDAYQTLGNRDVAEVAEARASIARAFPQHITPDLCEMTIVANATRLGFDRERLHSPIARIDEVATFFSRTEDGGLLDSANVIDVFHCLRRPDEVSFAGGVFVVVRCLDASIWSMLADKGHIVSRTGSTALIYIPRHLLGLEAATSVLTAALLKTSGGAVAPTHRFDLTAIANTDLPSGYLLSVEGHHHEIAGLDAAVLHAAKLSGDSPAPFYLAAGQRLKKAVRRGQRITMSDIEVDDTSEIVRMRMHQDRA